MVIKKSDKDKKYKVDFAGSIIVEARNKEWACYETYLKFASLANIEVQEVNLFKGRGVI